MRETHTDTHTLSTNTQHRHTHTVLPRALLSTVTGNPPFLDPITTYANCASPALPAAPANPAKKTQKSVLSSIYIQSSGELSFLTFQKF